MEREEVKCVDIFYGFDLKCVGIMILLSYHTDTCSFQGEAL